MKHTLLTLSTMVSGAMVVLLAASVDAMELPPPVADGAYVEHSPAKVRLGQLLFHDKELSGNRNISCASCHHTLLSTADGLSLSVGEGGAGLGPTRDTGMGADEIVERVPRNAPAVFNLGASEFKVMFHDGRVEVNAEAPSGFDSPAGDDLPLGLDNPVAVQAMFPPTSNTEMAGQEDENRIGYFAARGRVKAVWWLLAKRLRNIPEYVELFKEAFPTEITRRRDITFAHAANAIAAFEAVAWRSDDSPFDRYLRGDNYAMSRPQKRGMRWFFGKAGCSQCHGGVFQTDHDFHAVAWPQVGPGKGDGSDGHEDFGRERVTGDPQDRYKFRTPSLRNVALTAPYGHDGAYAELRDAVEHQLDPVAALNAYDGSQLVLPSRADLDAEDLIVMNDPVRVRAIADANELAPPNLTAEEIDELVAFLHALTDPAMLNLTRTLPKAEDLPSGLPLFD